MVTGRLLPDAWVSTAVLSGTGSFHGEGQDPEFGDHYAAVTACFLADRWQDYPENKPLRAAAQLDPEVDFVALGRVAQAAEAVPAQMLEGVSIPVLALNGGSDDGALDEWDLARFIPGARRIVARAANHFDAPSDPIFQGELVRFLLDATG